MLGHLILTSVTWHLQFIFHFYYIYIQAGIFMYKISEVYNLHAHIRNWRYNNTNYLYSLGILYYLQYMHMVKHIFLQQLI